MFVHVLRWIKPVNNFAWERLYFICNKVSSQYKNSETDFSSKFCLFFSIEIYVILKHRKYAENDVINVGRVKSLISARSHMLPKQWMSRQSRLYPTVPRLPVAKLMFLLDLGLFFSINLWVGLHSPLNLKKCVYSCWSMAQTHLYSIQKMVKYLKQGNRTELHIGMSNTLKNDRCFIQ